IRCSFRAGTQTISCASRTATTLCGDAESLPQFAKGADAVVDRLVDLTFGDGVAHAHIHSLALLPECGRSVRAGVYLVRISLPLRVARRTYCAPSCSIVTARCPPSNWLLFKADVGMQSRARSLAPIDPPGAGR